jgi:signal transduction histidine kinase
MEPAALSKPTRLPTLLHWLAWGLVAAALLRAGLLAFAAERQLAWVPWADVTAAGIVWSVIGMVVETSRRLPEHDRGAWLGVAVAMGFSASGVSQQVLLGVAQLSMALVAQLAGAGIASLLSVATLAANSDRQEPAAVRGFQALADLVAILGAVTLIGVVRSPIAGQAGNHIALGEVFAIVTDLVLIVVVVLLLITSPRALRAIQAMLWLMVTLRVLSLIGLPALPGVEARELLETLRASLSAPAILRWIEHRPDSIQSGHQMVAAWSPIPQVVVWLALAHTIIARDIAPAPALALLGIEVLRVTIRAVRRQHQLRRWWQVVQTERRARMAERAAAQEQITALARLVHDQAAPLSGLDRIYREIERAGIHGVARRIGDHLGLLLSLASQLRVALSDRPLTKRPPVVVEVLPIVRAVIDAAAERAQITRVDLFWAMSSEGATVLGDAAALRRVLDNLVTNALDATSAGGQVAVELWDDRRYPGWLTISVRDTGPGLTDEVREQVFRPGQMKSAGPGMGLGLGIVRELTELMGGVYGVTSRPGEGSAFWIRLPYAEQRQTLSIRTPQRRGGRDADHADH